MGPQGEIGPAGPTGLRGVAGYGFRAACRVMALSSNNTIMYPFYEYNVVEYEYNGVLSKIHQIEVGIWRMCFNIPEALDYRYVRAHCTGCTEGTFAVNKAGTIIVVAARGTRKVYEILGNTVGATGPTEVYKGIEMIFMVSNISNNSSGLCDPQGQGFVDITIIA